ncbi:MAG: class I SAM-dependent methyltransferase [Chloroflexota bacterium]|nr:class I SAM-dependent methyltransferase [Chloroflexota bacterium]
MLVEQYRDGRNLEARIRLHAQFSANPVGLHPWLLAQIDVPPQASVLELGCGVGSFWVTNRDSTPPGWRVTLTDISPGMVREAELRLGDCPGFTFATAAAEALPFPDATFDAVFAHFMLYHVDDRPLAIREMARVLRPAEAVVSPENGQREPSRWCCGCDLPHDGGSDAVHMIAPQQSIILGSGFPEARIEPLGD